jgi:phage terminase small subunit
MKRFFSEIVRDFDLSSHHIALLTLLCEALDRGEQARQRIARDGAYIENRFGQLRQHPAVAVERDSRLAAARLTRELDLDADLPADSRPPSLRRYS